MTGVSMSLTESLTGSMGLARRRPGFGYRLLDLLACPHDGAWPLKLRVDDETTIAGAADDQASGRTVCDRFCGRLGLSVYQLEKTPDCGSCLETEVREGCLSCPDCERSYSVQDGVASFLEPDAADADKVREQQTAERTTRDAEAAIYDDLYPDAEYVHELNRYAELIRPTSDDRVLDIGCGTGRVIKVYAGQVRETLGIDFSRLSIIRLLERDDLPRGALVWAVQADATSLPLRRASFDKVVCLSVICFMPSRELELKLLDGSCEVLRKDGTIVISTYHYAVVKRLWALAGRTEGALKRGVHSGGSIPYVNHTPQEFCELMASHAPLGPIHGICHRVPLLSKLHPRLSALLDGLAGRSRLGRWLFATEMVASAKPSAPSAERPRPTSD